MKTVLLLTLAIVLVTGGCPGQNAPAAVGPRLSRTELATARIRLASTNPEERRQAFETLRRSAPDLLQEELCRLVAQDETDRDVRLFAARHCSELGRKASVPVLITVLNGDPSATLAETIRESLADLTGHRFDKVAAWDAWWAENKDRSRAEWLFERLERYRKEAREREDRIVVLSRRLADYIVADYREQIAELKKSKNDDKIVPLLAEALEERLAPVKVFALTELGRTGNPKALESIEPFLEQDDAAIRTAAVSALASLGVEGAAERIAPYLKDPSPQVRQEVIMGLGRLAHKPARPEIERLLMDRDEEVASAAARALGDLGDPKAVASLVGVLPSPHEKVRWFAVTSLGRLKSKEAVKPLTEAFEDEAVPGVRQAIVGALGEIGSPEALPLLHKALESPEEEVRLAAWEAVKSIDAEAFDLAEAEIRRQVKGGHPGRAIELYELVSKRYGKDPALARRLGMLAREMIGVYLGQDKPMQALTLIRQLAVADRNMTDSDLHFQRLEMEVDQNFAEAAVEQAERLALKWPERLAGRMDLVERIVGMLLDKELPRKALGFVANFKKAGEGKIDQDTLRRLDALRQRAEAVLADVVARDRRRADLLIARLPDAEDRAAVVETLQGLDLRTVVVQLVKALGAEEAAFRAASFEALEALTDVEGGHGYDPTAPEAERDEAIRRWERWIEKRRW